ncbi:MAG: ATP-binding protein [Candidatus Magnetoovum sp. WYHC-5]|nr:ATP-binding protein [Candidatus Magnetoovum sp. WYHC-5]
MVATGAGMFIAIIGIFIIIKTNKLQVTKTRKEGTENKDRLQYMHTEKLASIGRLAAGVAHELNSPLTGIIIFSRLLYDKTPKDDISTRDDLNIIIEQAQKCSNIVSNLVGYSRHGNAKQVSVNLNHLIEKTLFILANHVSFHNIIIERQFEENIPLIVCDPLQLEQVFINILMNAADAMELRGKIYVNTRHIADSNIVEASIMDTGPGIDKDLIEKIFNPFFTTKPISKGTGLGLYVSREIINNMKGSISVTNKEGFGAHFKITLPIISLPPNAHK